VGAGTGRPGRSAAGEGAKAGQRADGGRLIRAVHMDNVYIYIYIYTYLYLYAYIVFPVSGTPLMDSELQIH
jgi:hypothetical protein